MKVTVLENKVPYLPLKGNIDPTYRCNNTCKHCWSWLSENTSKKNEELTFDEIHRIIDEARALGCRQWAISGGEPMLRDDFTDIFDYITRKSVSYSINTNGTLITPAIAKLLTRKGAKMVALYGATAEVHDYITRNPGSFDATMRGFAYLKEAGAGFIVQVIPIRDSYHQFNEMISLAKSLSPHWRIGATWLYLSACGSKARNREIMQQRLDPAIVVELDKPDMSYQFDSSSFLVPRSSLGHETNHEPRTTNKESYDHEPRTTNQEPYNEEHLFASCIANRRDFHIDPYGQMSFCSFIKDPKLRYDLRKGTFHEAWEKFIPSLANTVCSNDEYRKNCGTCNMRSDCHWCPVYAYLEHGGYSAKVEYLCEVAKENRKFKENWKMQHRRYYEIAGITIQIDTDLPITEKTFHEKLNIFQIEKPGEDVISIHHHFELPELKNKDLGSEIYCKPPWAIYRKDYTWIYLGISTQADDPSLHRVAVFNAKHTQGRIYSPDGSFFIKGGLHSLTMFASDQIFLARVLADRQGCYLHAAGMVVDGKGYLFIGHSEAGKSTTVTMLKDEGEILCDDRIIVRRWPEGFKIHGTWSHGDVPIVSNGSAPLHAILFIEKSETNRIIPIQSSKEIAKKLLFFVIKPLVTADWWEKTFDLIEKISHEVPAYTMEFDKSGKIIESIKQL